MHNNVLVLSLVRYLSTWYWKMQISLYISVNTAKSHKNVITYSGLLHAKNVSTLLQKIRFTVITHNGPLTFDPGQLPKGLDPATIAGNNALFLDLLTHS